MKREFTLAEAQVLGALASADAAVSKDYLIETTRLVELDSCLVQLEAAEYITYVSGYSLRLTLLGKCAWGAYQGRIAYTQAEWLVHEGSKR